MAYKPLVFHQDKFVFFLSLGAIGPIGITKSAFEPFLSDKIHRILCIVKGAIGSWDDSTISR
ncbi:MAG: hypothetical protein R3295_13705 [Marinobacter sp.]|nr:hypothetical protein [Marinobacter sp.]